MSWRRLLLLAAATALTVTAGLAVLVLLFGQGYEVEGQILATTALVAALALVTLPAAVLLEDGRRVELAAALVAVAVADFALLLGGIWADGGAEWFEELAVTLSAFAVALAQVGAQFARSDRLGVVGLSAAGLVLVLASMASAAAWAELDSEGYFRALGALAVVDVFLLLVQPLAGRIRGVGGAAEYRLLVDGEERVARGRDFASAAAAAIRAAEREGAEVRRVERRA